MKTKLVGSAHNGKALNIYDIIADDSYAITFQSMGQYRTALLKNRPKFTHKDFEDFLWDKFYKENPMTLDDDAPDAFEDWKQELDIDEVIKWTNDFNKGE